MKILGRILVILAAALLVVGATVALSQTGVLNSIGFVGGRGLGQGEGFGRQLQVGQRPQRAESAPGATGEAFRGDFDRTGGFNVIGILPLIRNLGIIAAITAVIVGIGYMNKTMRKRKMPAQPGSGAVSGQ